MKTKLIVTLSFLFLLIGFLVFLKMLIPQLSPIPIQEPLKVEWTTLSSSINRLEKGFVQYQHRCSTCHGDYGKGGLKGPSLVDEFWIYR